MPNTPQANYSVFWHTFAENYPFFELHHADWAAVDREYRPRVTAATTPQDLFNIFQEMIEPLHDAHTSLDAGDLQRRFRGSRPGLNKVSPTDYQKYAKIVWSQYVRGELKSFCKGKVWFGMLDDSVGYLLVPAFIDFADGQGFRKQAESLEDALDGIFADSSKLKGLVIDVRFNTGGYSGLGEIIASRLTGREYLAYSIQARDNIDGPLRFAPAQQVRIAPSKRPGYQGKAVLLIGPDCVSAGETFAMALLGRKPAVVRVGARTEGVFSDVLSRNLPNGWHFGLPNEVYLTESGTSFDGVGVPPDVPIPIFPREDLQSNRDSAIEKALAILR